MTPTRAGARAAATAVARGFGAVATAVVQGIGARRIRWAAVLLGLALVADAGVLIAVPVVAHADAVAHQQAAQQAAEQQRADARSAAAVRAARGGTSLQDPAPQTSPSRSTAVPTRIIIPTIDVDADVQKLARDSMGVLQPPDDWTSAGWYAKGVVPGDIGAAVIAGHLDTTKRAAVFVALRFLRPGDPIEIRMSDGRTLHFVVDRSQVVQKALFPSQLVYGATPDPQLRLITCSEPFDPAKGIYADNLVVFATLR